VSELSTAPEDPPARGTGPMLLTLAGWVAAFGVASCCGLPSCSRRSAWDRRGWEGLLYSPRRLFLLAAATVRLAGGAVLLWRRRSMVVCAPGAPCTRPVIRGVT
jgi:mercuric ion transport protein